MPNPDIGDIVEAVYAKDPPPRSKLKWKVIGHREPQAGDLYLRTGTTINVVTTAAGHTYFASPRYIVSRLPISGSWEANTTRAPLGETSSKVVDAWKRMQVDPLLRAYDEAE